MANTQTAATGAARRLAHSPYTQAVAIFVVVRLTGLLLLALFAAWHDLDLIGRLTAWDGHWYLTLAEHGYTAGDGAGLTDSHGRFTVGHTTLAFFPLYPWLISIIGMPGIGLVPAAIAISWVAGAVAACGVVRLARQILPGRRPALILVALWAGAPMAITFSMAYTESLFSALAVWTLVFVLERRWIPSAALCVLAGLTRPTASALVAAVVIGAFIGISTERRWAPVFAVMIAPLGLLGFWAFVAQRTGRLDGWMELERQGWNTGFDFGVSKAEFVARALLDGRYVMTVGAVVVLLATIALAILCFRMGLPWPLRIYAVGVIVLVAGSSGLPAATARFLLPAAFVLLVPVALGLSHRTRATAVLATSAIVLAASWYSAYALTGWQYAV